LKDFKFSGDNNLDFACISHRDDDDESDRNHDEGVDRNLDEDGIDRNYDDEGVGINYDDEGVGVNYDDEGDHGNYDISGVFDEEDINPHARLTEKDYVMAMVNNENELFSYFDSAFLRNWAGPEHWKLKRTNKSILLIFFFFF